MSEAREWSGRDSTALVGGGDVRRAGLRNVKPNGSVNEHEGNDIKWMLGTMWKRQGHKAVNARI